MGLLGWFKGRGPAEDPRLREWRRAWGRAAQAWETAAAGALAAQLDALGLPEDEIEIEREMAEALARAAELDAETRAHGLPRVETGHRVVGADTCHFSAPASMPDEPSQPSGRVLLTSARAIFVGGSGGSAIPWHAVREVAPADRDLILVRAGGERMHRFRFNTYGDALCAAYLARRLGKRL
jgi:hypothetical protein